MGSFGAAQSQEDGSDCDILNDGGWNVGVLGKHCAEAQAVCE